MKRLLPLVFAGLMLVGCAAGRPVVDNAGPAGLLIVPEDLRPPAPSLRGTALTGERFALTTLLGQVVVLNGYASWCPPCLTELPALAAADRDLPGLQVVGIDVADSPQAGLGVLEAIGATYPALDDPRGVLLSAFTGSPTRGLPFSIIIDPQGRVAGRIIGPATDAMLAEVVAAVGA